MADFFAKIALPIPNEDDLVTLEKVNIIIAPFVDTSTSQKIIFTILKIAGISKESTIRVIGFNSQMQFQIHNAIVIFKNLANVKIRDGTQLSNKVEYTNWCELFAKTTLPMPNKNDQAILDKVDIVF